MTDEAAALWKSISGHVAEQVSEVVWQTTFREIKGMSFDGHALTLQAPSILARDRIENRYRELLSAAMTDAGLDRYDLIIEVDPTVEAILAPDPVAVVRPDGMNAGDGGAVSPSAYNPKYTFESFVTGPSNRFAQAAALSVAETPARSYNPLFVYGSAGLGKTHLLQAIANYVIVNYPAYRVRYISTEELLNEFVDAIRNGNTSDFKRRFREIDVLLVDDIQFMEGKEQLQEEFFYTFNTLRDRHVGRSLAQSFQDGAHHRYSATGSRNAARHRAQKVGTVKDAVAASRPRVHRYAHHQQHPRNRRRPQSRHGLCKPHPHHTQLGHG